MWLHLQHCLNLGDFILMLKSNLMIYGFLNVISCSCEDFLSFPVSFEGGIEDFRMSFCNSMVILAIASNQWLCKM